MKNIIPSILLYFIAINVFSNPVVSDDFLYLEEEQVWIDVGAKQSTISGTFFFKLGKYSKSIYTFYVPIFVPLGWETENIKQNTAFKFFVDNTVITQKILDENPDFISLDLSHPENQKVIWYEITTTEFIGAKTAGVEIADEKDKNNVIHGKRGKLLWRENNSSIPPISISYVQRNYKDNGSSNIIYVPLLGDNNPDAKNKEHGFIRFSPQKGHRIELISKLPKGTWNKIDGDIIVTPRNREEIIIKIETDRDSAVSEGKVDGNE